MGPTGTPGANGPVGPTGTPGVKGDNGTIIRGSANSLGEIDDGHYVNGDGYLVDGILHVYDEAHNTWNPIGSLKGPTGAPGAQGPTGAPGPTGPGTSTQDVIAAIENILGYSLSELKDKVDAAYTNLVDE